MHLDHADIGMAQNFGYMKKIGTPINRYPERLVICFIVYRNAAENMKLWRL